MAEAVTTTSGLHQNARGRVAAFAGPSLALPRVLQHNVIGLGNAAPLQTNRKRRRTAANTAAGTDAGTAAGAAIGTAADAAASAATSSPRSSWITAQWRTVSEGRGKCLHCGDDRSINNITRQKQHLLKCIKSLNSPAAQEAAVRCSEVTAAIAQQAQSVAQQATIELTEQQQFEEDVMRLAIDNNWSFHFVEQATTQAFFKKWLPHLKLPSRWEVWDQRMLYGHHPALYLAAVTDPNFRDKHAAFLPDHLRSAEDLAARLASMDGRGEDSAAAQVRDEFHTWCSEGYMVKMKLGPNIFHPRLLRDPVTWWEWYGRETPLLQQVAQRVLSIPATSAGVERLFSVFKYIWSDRRSRLLMGRMWAMAYVYFNTRALKQEEQPTAADAADVEQWEEWMASQPVEGAPLM